MKNKKDYNLAINEVVALLDALLLGQHYIEYDGDKINITFFFNLVFKGIKERVEKLKKT